MPSVPRRASAKQGLDDDDIAACLVFKLPDVDEDRGKGGGEANPTNWREIWPELEEFLGPMDFAQRARLLKDPTAERVQEVIEKASKGFPTRHISTVFIRALIASERIADRKKQHHSKLEAGYFRIPTRRLMLPVAHVPASHAESECRNDNRSWRADSPPGFTPTIRYVGALCMSHPGCMPQDESSPIPVAGPVSCIEGRNDPPFHKALRFDRCKHEVTNCRRAIPCEPSTYGMPHAAGKGVEPVQVPQEDDIRGVACAGSRRVGHARACEASIAAP